MANNENNLTPRHRVLILGNGFDLHHNLPTSYSDFLDICRLLIPMKDEKYNGVAYSSYYDRKVRPVEKQRSIQQHGFQFHPVIQRKLDAIYHALNIYQDYVQGAAFDKSAIGKLYHDLNQNIWYEYFRNIYAHNRMDGENWIDFEREISAVEDWFDDPDKHIRSEEKLDRIFTEYVMKFGSQDKIKIFFGALSSIYVTPRELKVGKLIDDLYSDLNRIEEALEIYLTEFVYPIEPDTDLIVPELKSQDFDCLLSYNYTDTFHKYYDHGENTEYCFIHGKCRDESDIKDSDSNVILGTGFINGNGASGNFSVFRKFMQRGMKGNANISSRWIEEMQEAYEKDHQTSEIWICGHSLDATDKDTLVNFIEPDYASVYIVCRKGDQKHLMTNLAKMIGDERLENRMNSYPRMLNFKYILHERS